MSEDFEKWEDLINVLIPLTPNKHVEFEQAVIKLAKKYGLETYTPISTIQLLEILEQALFDLSCYVAEQPN